MNLNTFDIICRAYFPNCRIYHGTAKRTWYCPGGEAHEIRFHTKDCKPWSLVCVGYNIYVTVFGECNEMVYGESKLLKAIKFLRYSDRCYIVDSEPNISMHKGK